MNFISGKWLCLNGGCVCLVIKAMSHIKPHCNGIIIICARQHHRSSLLWPNSQLTGRRRPHLLGCIDRSTVLMRNRAYLKKFFYFKSAFSPGHHSTKPAPHLTMHKCIPTLSLSLSLLFSTLIFYYKFSAASFIKRNPKWDKVVRVLLLLLGWLFFINIHRFSSLFFAALYLFLALTCMHDFVPASDSFCLCSRCLQSFA